MDPIFKDQETTSVLHWSTLTPVVNEIKSPAQFVRRFIFGNHVTLSTEKVELGFWDGSRDVAPFIRKHSEAVLVDGYGERFATVEPANIRMKTIVHPKKAFDRRPGDVIFVRPGESGPVLSSLQRYVGLRAQRLADLETNAEEYLCCQALRGSVTYSVDEAEAFTVTFPRPAGNNVTLTTFWDDADPSLPELEQDFYQAKKIISDEVGLQPTDVILGAEAVLWFMSVLKQQKILDMLHYFAGDVSLASQFSEDGAIYLGLFSGIKVWAYPRQVNVNGVATDLIRPKYAEFIANSAAAENLIYYAAIDDEDALESGSFVTERFSKTWKTPDPSQRFMLLHSRPMPCTRRPGSMVSMKVVSG
jgi:hypothetical protein